MQKKKKSKPWVEVVAFKILGLALNWWPQNWHFEGEFYLAFWQYVCKWTQWFGLRMKIMKRKKVSSKNTVWNFSATLILREIDSESQKLPQRLEALSFGFLRISYLKRSKMSINSKFRVKMAVFDVLKSAKIGFISRKIAKFAHCDEDE